jgi:hypothetical protein
VGQASLGVCGPDGCRDFLGSTLIEVSAILFMKAALPFLMIGKPVELACEPEQNWHLGSAPKLQRERPAIPSLLGKIMGRHWRLHASDWGAPINPPPLNAGLFSMLYVRLGLNTFSVTRTISLGQQLDQQWPKRPRAALKGSRPISKRQRCVHPGQQHGRLFPSARLSHPQAMRFARVSAFFGEMIQQIHSLRASGVMSRQVARAPGDFISAASRSVGRS